MEAQGIVKGAELTAIKTAKRKKAMKVATPEVEEIDDDWIERKMNEDEVEEILPLPNISTQVRQSMSTSKAVEDEDSGPSNQNYMSPLHVMDHLNQFWEKETEILDLMFCGIQTPPCEDDMEVDEELKITTNLSHMNASLKIPHSSPSFFFLSVLPITPNCFRPPSKMGEETYEHPQNERLKAIISRSEQMRTLKNTLADKGAILDKKFLDLWVGLQSDINSLIDSAKGPTKATKDST